MAMQSNEFTTVEQLLQTGIIDSELAETLKRTPLRSYDTSSIAALKAQVAYALKVAPPAQIPPPPGVEEIDQAVLARDGHHIPVKVFRPTLLPADAAHSQRAVLVMFHGGGFCLGDPSEEIPTCRMFVQHFDGVAVSVGYRLAPEDPFPAGINDAWDTVQYVAKNAAALGGDLAAGFMVGGVSAGGSIAAIMACKAVDDALQPRLTGAYVSIPSIVPPHLVPAKYKHLYISGEQNKYAPLLSDELIACFRAGYQADETSKLATPLNYGEDVLRRLPRTYVQVCGMDRFRDQGLIYERYLREDLGVETRLDLYVGMPHAFWGAFLSHPLTARQRQDTLEGLRWLLKREKAA